MNSIVRFIVFLSVIIFVFETRPVLAETKSPPYFVKQPTTKEILFFVQTDDSTERLFEIPCEAKGIPEPDYFWTKNGQLFNWTSEGNRISQKPGNGTLIIRNTKVSDAGQYQCFAENIWGIATSNSVIARRIELESFRDEIPVAKKVTEGQPYNLTCKAPGGYPKPNVNWLIQDYNGKVSGIDDPRITVDPEGTLWFSSIAPEDAVEDSVYSCAVTSLYISEVKTGSKVILQVEPADPPQEIETAPILQYVSKTEQIATYNQKIRLYCIFGGNPLPTITWYKNGELLKFRTGTLSKDNGKSIEIKRVISLDEGNYTCEASNGHGDPISHTIDLKVLVEPRFVKKPESVTIDEQETVEFHCQATGIPQPEIIWTHNGKPLSEAPSNPRRSISDNSIVIEGLWKNDTGNYGCNATNSVGYVYQDAFVNVLAESPNITEFPRDEEIIEGSTVTMKCRAEGSPKPRIIWMRNEVELVGGRFTTTKSGDLTITTATFSDIGEYTCSAQNKISSIQRTLHLDVRSRTKIDLPPDSFAIEVPAGQPAILKCVVIADPALDFNTIWSRNEQYINVDEQHFVQGNDSLIIKDTSESDSGTYTCMAVTKLDNATAEISLIVQNRPNPPAIISLACNDRDAEISWENNGDHQAPIIHYIIEYSSKSDPDKWDILNDAIPVTETTFKVKMDPWANYTFRIKAENKIGISSPSEPSSVCSSAPDVPYKNPENVTAHAITKSRSASLVIQWESMPVSDHNGPKFHYNVFWKANTLEATWANQIISDWEIEEHQVPNVPHNTQFLIKVIAENEAGPAWVVPQTVRCDIPADIPTKNPENVTFEVTDERPPTLKISWEPMSEIYHNGPGFYYNVSWKKDGAESSWQTETISYWETTENAVPSVQPFAKYLITVIAANELGPAEPAAEPITFSTPADTPYKNPENVTIDTITEPRPAALHIQWKPMSELDHNGLGFYYDVSWKADTPKSIWESQTISNWEIGEHTVPDVPGNTKFLVKVTAGNEIGEASVAADILQYVTPVDIPAKNPDNVTIEVTDDEPSTLKISWEPIPEIHHNGPGFYYNISWKNDRLESQWQIQIISNWEIQEFKIPDVRPYELYYVVVIAGNEKGHAEPLPEPIIYITPPDIPYKNPDGVTVQATTPTTSVVSWKPMPKTEQNGPGFYYNISWKLDTSELAWESHIIEDAETTEYTLNLPPYEKHQVKVIAGNTKGLCSLPPTVIEGYYEEEVPLEAPSNLTLVEILSPTKANISWNRVPKAALRGNFEGYKIEIWQEYNDQKNNMTEIIVEQNFDSYIIDKLTPNVRNKIRINVFNGKHAGPFSDVLEINTPEGVPDPVESLEATPLGSTALSLIWKPPLNTNGNLTGYKIYYQTVSGDELGPLQERIPQITNPNQTRVRLSDLEPDTDYTIIIQATTNAGEGEKFLIKQRTGNSSTSLIIPDFQLVPVDSENFTSVKIVWMPCGENIDMKDCSNQSIGSGFRIDYGFEDNVELETITEKNADSVIISDLQPNKEYKFRVSSVDGTLVSESKMKSFETTNPSVSLFDLPADSAENPTAEEQSSDQHEGTVEPRKEEISTTVESSDFSKTKTEETKSDSEAPNIGWIILILSIIALVVIVILILAYLKKLNQGNKYIVREQEIKNGRPDCLDDPDYQEAVQLLNEDIPADPKSDSTLKLDNDGMVTIPLN
ncbi:neuroglian-like [Planococcus citri]|uniref:neuroglian-like n=1 Tax=Planococcus citri TaxID=170843 RepID=UPI0031F9FA84